MESHILNMYHQAPYRSIGHKIIRSTSESLSSESSCNQNSPEYTQSQQASQYEEESNEGEYWNHEDNHRVWSQNQNVNITQSNQDTSIDDDENIEIQEVSIDDKNSESNDQMELLEGENIEENSLVEGDDYDVIQVFAVDPDLDFEASSDEDQEYSINENGDSDDGEYLMQEDKERHKILHKPDSICQDSLGINFDTPVVSNVDEYFIKDTNKHILELKDEPVVKDVDEYFIKENKEEVIQTPIVDHFFTKQKLPEETDFRISKTVPNVNEIFANGSSTSDKDTELDAVQNEDPAAEVSINESDLEVLPNIEDLKRYLLEDMPYTKLKNAQKTCSVSLPHSPMHNICMDIDAKTCLSFEDLNLDLSDLTFENDKEKSGNSIKSDDLPRTLTEEDVNSFLITDKKETNRVEKNEDDFDPQDMDIDRPVDSVISSVTTTSPIAEKISNIKRTSTPVPGPNVLEFCIEKPAVKKEPDIKTELDDFVDVESCNDTVIPVLEANNLNSLLEQFEASEKLNIKRKKPTVNISEPKTKSYSLTSGMRLQDAGVQLNKTKMRHILMPSTVNTVIRRSPSPVHSDHDYCSSKKRHSLPNLKGGQSLLKPEVLSSNSRILSSRHRSCKNKKVVYHLSSDEESDANNTKKNKTVNNRSTDDSDIKLNKKSSIKLSVKTPLNSNHRKKVSPARSALNDSGICKTNDSVMVKNACKASDNPCSQNSNGSIKLTIKNKSEVIIKNCDAKDIYKNTSIEKHKSSSSLSNSTNKLTNLNNIVKNVEQVDRNKNEDLSSDKNVPVSVKPDVKQDVKHDVNSKPEDFYAALFSNKQDVQVPVEIKSEIKNNEDERVAEVPSINEIEQPQKKKKLNLQEYKLRRGVSSNSSSAQVSPEAIFPDMPCNLSYDKDFKMAASQPSNNILLPKENADSDASKTIFDPIREASRKILMNNKKQKAEAMRKRDEDFVMSKIPKVENLELQPLISDAEMMKIVGMTPEVLPSSIPPPVTREDKVHQPIDYDEIVLVSIGTNTDENLLKTVEKICESKKRKSESPQAENKSTINFKIKKSDHVSKHNVFDLVKSNRCPIDDKNRSDIKIDKERFKDITATLKSVERQVETKISSNSLFASIQDVVMKKAPNCSSTSINIEQKSNKPSSPNEKREVFKYTKTIIVREYDSNAEHGEDKVILHLDKNRNKPNHVAINIQTDSTNEFADLAKITEQVISKDPSPSPRKRNDSDMSMSSEDSPVRAKMVKKATPTKSDARAPVKQKTETRRSEQLQTKEKRSRSRDRYDIKYRRSRSHSRGHRRKRSPSRNRSRSRGRYRRYRRSDSPYRRKRRSRTRSPYRSSRRSPSVRRDYRSNRSRSRSKHMEKKSRSPVPKKRQSPQYNIISEKKPVKSLTPPPRKPTVSESSESSTSSSSSSSSSSSASSKSRGSCSPYRKDDDRNVGYRSYSSEDRESNTPVEERRIVFVGRLEKDITKAALRAQFVKFGPVSEVRLHSKEDGSRYGFVTFQRPRDAWSAVEAANTFPQYDVGFGGRRAFCRQSYADLDGLEAKYTESAFHGQPAIPTRRNDDMSFEQMLLDIKKKLNKRKCDKNRDDDNA